MTVHLLKRDFRTDVWERLMAELSAREAMFLSDLRKPQHDEAMTAFLRGRLAELERLKTLHQTAAPPRPKGLISTPMDPAESLSEDGGPQD